jgi:trehalose 6-phosphate phosphatase
MMRRNNMTLPTPAAPASAREWALFLDVDGTLLDFAPAPDAVKVPPALIDLLAHLHTQLRGALALISGRSIMTLDQLFEPLRLPCAGLHGVERRDSSGTWHRTAVDATGLARLHSAIHELSNAFPDVLIEDKRYAVALHYGKSEARQAELRTAAEAIARDTGFELQPGRLVFELKPPAVTKGDALTAFLAEEPFAGRLPVFLGDDLTDEHALEVAKQHGGMAIQIGTRLAGAGQFALADPAAVLRWLQNWGEHLS